MDNQNQPDGHEETARGRTITVFIDRARYDLATPTQTGASLKALAGIPLTDVLFLRRPGEDPIITNAETVILKNGDHLYAQPPADYGSEQDDEHEEDDDDHERKDRRIVIFINRVRFELQQRRQTGQELKVLGNIALTDVLFRRRPGADQIVRNEKRVVCKDNDHFYSQPPADYGAAAENIVDDLEGFELQQQPDGWTFAIHNAFLLPDAYAPRVVRLLIKLPPTFPDAAPDMFYVTPVVRTVNGDVPVGATMTPILGEEWQQFSWHLAPGAWQPGISDFREYMRCVRSRFERRN